MSADANPLKLVVFDCDGTLVDSQYNIISCMTTTFNEAGLIEPSDEAVRSNIGLNLDRVIHNLMEDKDDLDLLAKLVAGYREAFLAHRLSPDHHEPLFEGVKEALTALDNAGTLMGVATGKALRGLRFIIDMHDLDPYFMSLQTPDHNPGKPHPQMLERAMADAGTDPANTFMIGDTSFDMMLAKNAGCTAVGVSWGYHDDEMLMDNGADHLIHNYSELFNIIHP